MACKNVVIILTDQQRYDTISALGNPAIQTPGLDALTRDSVRFEHCVTPSPVCVPARFSLYSGQYCARTGNNNNNAENSYGGSGFYGELTARGYQSCAVGKMHFLPEPYGSLGFEKRCTQEEMAAPEDDYTGFIVKNYPGIFDYNGMRSEMYYVPQISPLPAKAHPTQWVGDRSTEFIRDSSGDRPMFLVSSFIHPHPPYAPPAPWQKLYRDDPPAPYLPDGMEEYRELLGDRCSCERLEISPQDLLRTKNFYYACVSFVDWQVSRIIRALKDKGIYDDTLIVFTSDHGDMMGDFGCIGKRTMVDAACRVPLLVHYPGQESRSCSDVCSLVDIAPTVLGFAGVEYPCGEYDGLDLFGGEKHEYVFSQHGCGGDGMYMITDGRVKLIYRAASQSYYYFDVMPEGKNVYDPADPLVRELQGRLDSYILSDVNTAGASRSYEMITKTHPHYPGRMDHAMRRGEELAAIPPGYKIDLD